MLNTKRSSKFTEITYKVDEAIEMRRKEYSLKTSPLEHAILNSANFSIIATDEKGIIQLFNIGAERMLGYQASEVINQKKPSEMHDPKEVATRAQALSLEFSTLITPGFEALSFKASRGIEDIYELTYTRKNGSHFPAIISITALRDEQANIIGYLLIGADNTIRKQSLMDLRESEERFRKLFDLAPLAIYSCDANGVIVGFNRNAAELWGRKPTLGDTVDRYCGSFKLFGLDGNVISPELCPMAEVLNGKVVNARDVEVVIERPNGSRINAIVNIDAFKNELGEITGAINCFHDITKRKQAEEESRQFFTLSHEMLCIAGFDGYFKNLNSSWEKTLGYSVAELLAKPFSEFIHPDDRKATVTEAKRLVNGGEMAAFENRYLCKDGSYRWILWSTTVDFRNQLFYCSARDVTEHRLAEEALHQSNINLEHAKLLAEKANLAKSDFLSSMSHELRTPLNAILGFAQLLESSSPQPTASQKRSIYQILQAGWYLLDLINEILDLALIESGKLSLSLEIVSLNDVMLECRAMVEPQAHKHDVSLIFPMFGISRYVKADRTRVKQVLINLLSNAIKYNKLGGKVIVRYMASVPGRIRICVEDNGEGLPQEKIAQLFQPFNRLGKESKGEEGTGIGLVMTKRLIELMGGSIGVESMIGKGSIFWIELNLTDERQADPEVNEPEILNFIGIEPGTETYTMLYIEDNPANLMLIEDILRRRSDIRLLTANNGIRGIEIARGSRPDLILMDINLPGISGITALRILQEDPVTAHIPVLALSANAVPRNIKKSLEAGFFRYITKPIKVSEFIDTLDLTLRDAKNHLATELSRNKVRERMKERKSEKK